jgi:superfamily II DNA or RNA helicase
MRISPRPYQRDAIQKTLAYAAENPSGRLLLVIPTRGGKTLIGAIIVSMLALRHGLKALWLVHREELLDEAVAHLVGVGISRSAIGVIKSGRSSSPDAKIQVASEATLVRRGRPDADLVVTDEAHRDTAPRRRRLRRAYPKAFLLGLTATPKPPPQRDLGEDYDTLMVIVQPSELIHDGFLAAPVLFAPDRSATPNLRGIRVVDGDYRPEDLEPLLVESRLLDEQVSEWARLADDRTSIAFPVTVAHSLALVARFQSVGIKAQHLDGNVGSAQRRSIIDGLRAGTIPIVSSVGVLSEGTNLPRVKCVLGVRPTCSLALYIQQSMRCATPWQDVRPHILDVVGNVYIHGFPFDDRQWSLVNAESGAPVGAHRGVVKRCHGCGAVSPLTAGSCTNCSASFPPSPTPSMPSLPLKLHEVSPSDAKFSAERARLVEYAKQRAFARPEEWADRVLVAKHGSANGF